MPSDECPCPNTWVCALMFYFRMETVGGDYGDCQASCHRVRCEVWGVRCEVVTPEKDIKLSWTDWGWQEEQLQQGSVPLWVSHSGFHVANYSPAHFHLFPPHCVSPATLRTFWHHFITDWLPGDWSGHIIKLLPLPLLLLLLSSPATRSPLICHWIQLIDHLNIWGRKAGVVVSAGLYFSQQGIIFELNLTEQIPNS